MFEKTKAKMETTVKAVESSIGDSAWGLACAIVLAGIFVSLGLLVLAASL